jgi:hypothetical protein
VAVKIERIARLDDLKRGFPEFVLLIHKDRERGFSVLGEPRAYAAASGLDLGATLLLDFVIDVDATRSFDGLLELYYSQRDPYGSFNYSQVKLVPGAILELYALRRSP